MMISGIAICLTYCILLFVLINLYFKVAGVFNIVDKPCERSSHTKPVLRGGGIIFPLGMILWFIWSGFQFPWFFAGLIMISFISFMDDIRTVDVRIRLAVHFIAMLLLLIQLGMVAFPWWGWILVIIAATSIINAFNFLDGINGITTGYSFSVLIGFWVVNNYMVHFTENDFLYAIMLALCIFGFYNFRKRARCFAGDVGSVSVSFILIFLLFKLILLTGCIFYVLFLTVYGVDCAFTIVHRLILKENIFKPHRRHLYQVLANEGGISHLKVSSGYAVLQLIINLVVLYVISHASFITVLLACIGIILLSGAAYILVKNNRRLNPGGTV